MKKTTARKPGRPAKNAKVPAILRRTRGQRKPLREQMTNHYGGREVTPTKAARRLRTDVAYACRTLQKMVQLGTATRGEARGSYYIHRSE